jgi:hypothetical protein
MAPRLLQQRTRLATGRCGNVDAPVCKLWTPPLEDRPHGKGPLHLRLDLDLTLPSRVPLPVIVGGKQIQ